MKIETLKELEALVKMCNRQGVTTITVDGVTMSLSGPPDLKTEQPNNKDSVQTPDLYTEEQLLLWSAGQPFES